MPTLPCLTTENLTIRLLKPEDYSYLMQYEKNNRQHLAQWEPIREGNYYSELATQKRIQESYNGFINSKTVTLVAFNQDKSLMYEMLSTSISYMFEEFKLHRIMPNNHRSKKLLQRLGFEHEGLAKSYLKIAGKWQDHVLTAKINPKHLIT